MAQGAKVIFGQLLKVELRSIVHIEIKWEYFIHDRCDVSDNAQLDRRRPRRSAEFAAQLRSGRAIERLAHVLLEATIIDIDSGHRQAGDARISAMPKALERAAIL